jgi:hypothetical protein
MSNSRTLTIETGSIREDFNVLADQLNESWAGQPQSLTNAVFENTGEADLFIASYPDNFEVVEVVRADYKTLAPGQTLKFKRVNLAKVYFATADAGAENELEIYGDQD